MRFALPLIALAAVAAPVVAAPPADAKTVTVRIAFDDVDVSSADGRAVLEARIDAKLRKACTIDGIARYSSGRATRDEVCFTQARAAALAEVERLAAADTRKGRAIAAN